MKPWRPPEWENPHKTTVEDVNKSYPDGIPKGYHILQDAGLNEGYEEGADALLRALYEYAGKEEKQWFRLTKDTDGNLIIFMD